MIRKYICKESVMELAAAALLIFSSWNVLYPEFTLTGDSYRNVEEEDHGEEGLREDYYEILDAGRGEVEIRLSFLENKKGKRVRTAGPGPEQELQISERHGWYNDRD